jgi:hypothetical protein
MNCVPTGYLVCLQSVQYPYREFSDPKSCSAFLQDYTFSYRLFIVRAEFSVSVHVFSVPTECLAYLQNDQCYYRIFSMGTECSVFVQSV